MAKRCQMTRVGPQAGNTVSHANNRARTRCLPNLQKKRVFVSSKNKWVTLKLSARSLRTLDKYGGDIEAVAKKFKELKKWI